MLAADAAVGGKQALEDKQKVQIRELVGSLLDRVSAEDRILLTLKEVEGLSLKELEAIYKVKENALKVRLFRARQRALKAFDEIQEQELNLRASAQAGRHHEG